MISQQALPIGELREIGLDDLSKSASLLTRKDRKYIVPLSLARQLIAQGDLRVLEIDGLRSFRYESVYFDTPERVSYLDAAHRRRRRFKVRSRSYGDSGLTGWQPLPNESAPQRRSGIGSTT